MVTDEGNIKISSIVIFLSNPGEINAENPSIVIMKTYSSHKEQFSIRNF